MGKLEGHTSDTDLAAQRLRLWLQMLKAVRSVETQLRENLRIQYNSMTLTQFDVLAILHSMPDGLKMSDLSRSLVVSKGNVTGVVEKLAQDGLLIRQNLESDRRAFIVQITEKGRGLMDDVTAEHRKWIDQMMQSVAEPDVARGISIMLDIRQTFQTK